MRVLCINSDWQSVKKWERVLDSIKSFFGFPYPHPISGEEYTVLSEEGGFYVLLEFSLDEEWEKKWFIPLSEIDEMELVNKIPEKSKKF